MTSPHIAHTVEDVRRLAPVPGWYWIRHEGMPPSVPWFPGHLVMRLDGWDEVLNTSIDVRRWDEVQHESWDTALWSDEDMVGCEIIGPIPEPGT